MKKILISIFIILFSSIVTNDLMAQKVALLQQIKPVSIRGLSVVNNKVAWISSNKGYIAITINGGKTWDWKQINGFEKADFRDIEAFSDKEAIVMSSGTPALILKTIDGGVNWQLKYTNTDTTYFLDAMDFKDNKHGYVLGDPIDNKFVILETKNGGETWSLFGNRPAALPGEAAFAASGTCLRTSNKKISIATGGAIARYLTLNTRSGTWSNYKLPLNQGTPSKGAFSITSNNKIIVGGNYSKNKMSDSVICISDGNTNYFKRPARHGPSGYQSCIEHISNKTYLSTGTSGTNISFDNGQTWIQIGETSYNVCRKAKHGNLVLLAGDDGKLGLFKM